MLVGEGKQPSCRQPANGFIQPTGAVCELDSVVEKVHCKLGYPTFQSHLGGIRQRAEHALEVVDGTLDVGKPLDMVVHILASRQ